MKIVIYAFTEKGKELAGKLDTMLSEHDILLQDDLDDVEIICRWGQEALKVFGDDWNTARYCLFIGAVGIAVRTVAPFLQSKLTDPAVIVIDELGTYVIPILSGHYGGGNRAAFRIAELLDAQPVITTATDLHGKFAVDVFAQKNRLSIIEKDRIKLVSSAILRGEPVGICAQLSPLGVLPEGLVWMDEREAGRPFSYPSVGIAIEKNVRKAYIDGPFLHTLHLVPQDMIVGIGCRKGKSYKELLDAIQDMFQHQNLDLTQIRSIHSIDFKKEEPGLAELARHLHVPFQTYSSEQLKQAKGTFASSEFVEQVTGVDNVCERSAAYAAGDDYEWVLRKSASGGVTVAAVRIKACISF